MRGIHAAAQFVAALPEEECSSEFLNGMGSGYFWPELMETMIQLIVAQQRKAGLAA